MIEPIGRPSTWQYQLDEQGDSLQNIAFEIQDTWEKVAFLDAKGLPLEQRGDCPGGRYAYLNGTAHLGIILELLENE